MILAAARVVTASRVHAPGWVEIEGERIVAVGEGRPGEPGAPARADRDLGDATVVPGFVDVHVHGGGGGGFADGARESALRARRAHLAHGTTSMMASLVTASPGELLASVRVLAELAEEGEIRGIHLEGPWLSPARSGAHDPSQLRHPDLAEIDVLLAAAGGAIRMVTIAPELPGALAAVERLTAAGVVVAVGHTDADYARTARAIDAGATVATHLFNAMRPLGHREPGPVAALVADPRVRLELIADGVHLHPAIARGIEAAVGAERLLLVTDAMGAAACGDGAYRLGSLDVEVEGGVARLSGTGTIAGGTATMDALFRSRALGWPDPVGDPAPDSGSVSGRGSVCGRERGSAASHGALIVAVRMTATNPARAMGWDDTGDIAPGLRADLAVLDPRLRLTEVLVAG